MGGTDIATALSKLSPTVRDMLLTGDKRHRDRTGSGVQHSILVGTINAGLDFATAANLLRAPKHRVGAEYSSGAG